MSWSRCLAFTREFCETKVENLNNAIVPQHDVVGLDVAMNDANAVGRAEGAGDLNADLKHFNRSERTSS